MITIGVLAATHVSFREFAEAIPDMRKYSGLRAETADRLFLYLGAPCLLAGYTLDHVIMLPRFWENEDVDQIISILPQHMRYRCHAAVCS
jgi:hypothetical protein